MFAEKTHKSLRHFPILLTAVSLLILVSGCAGVKPLTPEEKFVTQVDGFIAELNTQQPSTVNFRAPVAIMPASLISGGEFTRLEEYAVNRLSSQLRLSRDIYTPSRQNWFEIRERQPFTFAGESEDKIRGLDDLVVYQISVSADEILKQVTLQATAVDTDSKPIPGILVETSFPTDDKGSPAMKQYKASPKGNPIPEGLEERPFVSMDRLTYSLASEMAQAYQANVLNNDDAPADSEVAVVLQARTLNGSIGNDFMRQLESSLQQAFVAKKGFTCSVSQKDFTPTFEQIDFYRRNNDMFEIDETLLGPGSVVLLAEAFTHKDNGKVGINLRSLWRVNPEENKQGQFIVNNLGGTYLSGFTAKAYLSVNSKNLKAGGTSSSRVDIRSSKDTRDYQPKGKRGFE